MTGLRFEDAGFTYPGASAPALAGCSFAADAGQVTWLSGALGAGTSTALLVAAGLAPRHTGGIRTGRVHALGLDPAEEGAAAALRGRVALVLSTPATQLSGIAETVEQEVAFAPANLAWPRDRIVDGVSRALRALAIGHLAGRDPSTLSGGEMQRVVLASMLVLAPELWLLDEPASALDSEGQRLLHQLLRAEAARGAAVVVASEEADGLAPIADRLVVFARGRAVLEGAPRDLLGGDGIWEAGGVCTSIGTLARAAGVGAPRPLTVEEGVTRWAR